MASAVSVSIGMKNITMLWGIPLYPGEPYSDYMDAVLYSGRDTSPLLDSEAKMFQLAVSLIGMVEEDYSKSTPHG